LGTPPHVGGTMNGCRVGYSLGLAVFVVVPLLMPFGGLLDSATWQWTSDDLDRLFQLGFITLILTLGTLALSLPLGLCLAVLLCRTHFLARRFLLFLLALSQFVPLPVIVSSWQGLLGADGLGTWLATSDRPWATGLGAAIWIHALAALPWVAFIVGLGLTWVEPELENEASQSVGAWRVLALVTLPRARASILASALFVVLQTAGETNVTDIMMVPTLADEVRTQFVRYDREALERTLLLSLPALLLIWGGALAILSYLEKHLPPPAPPFRGQRPLDLGPAGLRLFGAFLLLTLLIVPLFSLAWKLGLTGHPRHWSSEVAWHFLHAETRVLGKELGATLATAFLTGLIVAGLALMGCWLARAHAWFRWLLFSVLIWAWVLPGPVIGIGLHDLIMLLPEGPWKTLLYHGPSPLPIMWAQTIRALPIAVVFLWPVVRLIPQEFFEEARLGGAGTVGEFLHVVAPMTWRAALVTVLASTSLCLGEVAASARVETPGWESFTKLLLDRMHYGVDNTLAALSVLLLASLVVLGLVAIGLWKLLQRWT
jgi:iron(III) transport system permease protein